jgi:hypothetical protein
MPGSHRVVIVSDLHYAGEAEQARRNYEARVIRRWWERLVVFGWRHVIWLKDPLAHNHNLERFCAQAGEADLVVANGDYSCDSAFIGVSDEAAFASARQVVVRLRDAFAGRLALVMGDHELGKVSLFGQAGGLRLASWERATRELAIEPFWRRELGPWVLFGVTSTLLALPVYESESLPEERAGWWRLREQHLDCVRAAFAGLHPGQHVVLFCHDPSALPFLGRDPVIRARLGQLAVTVIGHLHTELILRTSRLLAGMPEIRFLGNAVRRMSTALREARTWRDFKVRLCPSPAGCELLKDGGFRSLTLPASGEDALWGIHPLPWETHPRPSGWRH